LFFKQHIVTTSSSEESAVALAHHHRSIFNKLKEVRKQEMGSLIQLNKLPICTRKLYIVLYYPETLKGSSSSFSARSCP